MSNTTDIDSDTLFSAIARLADATGAAPLNAREGCWEVDLGDGWWMALNGHTERTRCSQGADVPPFTAYVTYHGWPAGMLDPYGGIIAAGEGANAATFLAAVEATTRAAMAPGAQRP